MPVKTKQKTVTLIMTGASGAQYGLRLLEELVKADVLVALLVSRPAQIVINTETDLKIPSRASEIEQFFTKLYSAKPEQIKVYEREQWMAPIASGSGVADATVVCPCTTGTLSSIAVGASKTLIERAADVAIKERKKLILVVRETPFSDIHLENMQKVEIGTIVSIKTVALKPEEINSYGNVGVSVGTGGHSGVYGSVDLATLGKLYRNATKPTTAQQFIITKANGETIAITQPSSKEVFKIGDAVKLLLQDGKAKVIH